MNKAVKIKVYYFLPFGKRLLINLKSQNQKVNRLEKH